MKPIRIPPHTAHNLSVREFAIAEVEQTLKS